ncbi:hypothetical protein G7Z17_g1596 [Cylindrodendrum hubeiense]|uniref:F-box domain-containing protein n=1 Tax=Cylindrodendrum hubeiense TaxID=595255 RepID=A0A9P5LJX0_9HYPO|nr:hypothetical protein G7Z17_g1596 [Cylindrodendrum hubeiense]
MTQLLDLPNEILQEICEALSPIHVSGTLRHVENMWFNRVLVGALSNFSQTCSTIRNLAEPMLYQCPLTAGSGFISLVRTLCRRQDLAQMVRVLKVNGPWHLRRGHVISPQDVELFNNALSKCRGVDGQPIQVSRNWHLTVRPQPVVYTTDLFEYDPRLALSALALAQITNVLRLEVEYYDDEPSSFSFCHPGSLPRLTELYLEDGEARTGVNLNVVNDLLRAAPNLRVLEVCRIDSATNCTDHDNVVEVVMKNNHLNFESLQRIMEQFKNMQTLSYQAGNFPLDSGGQASPRDVSRALLTRADTLRDVSLWFTQGGIWPDRMDERFVMSSLKEMQVLERLEVDGHGLYDLIAADAATDGDLLTELLPPTIRSLKIDGIYDDVLPDILNLAKKAPRDFPNLRDICLTGLGEETRVTVRVAFAESGIKTDLDAVPASRYIQDRGQV